MEVYGEGRLVREGGWGKVFIKRGWGGEGLVIKRGWGKE